MEMEWDWQVQDFFIFGETLRLRTRDDKVFLPLNGMVEDIRLADANLASAEQL
jgi:hypothetical protein